MDVREKLVEMKPCPFCGCTAFLSEYEYKIEQSVVITHFVECNGCHATTFEYESKEKATENWNRRI